MSITAAQREQRKNYLGSSDMPTIMNVSPYKHTAVDVYWSKVAEKLPDEETESMSVGTWLEQPLIEWAADELGVEVTTDPDDLHKVATVGDGAGVFAANNDALVLGKDAGIEAKFASGDMAKGYGEAHSDEVPDHVIIQTQHQMYCSDLHVVYVALATPTYYGLDRRLYTVPRDEAVIEMMVQFGVNWWDTFVKTKTPPGPTSIPPMYVLKALHREKSKVIELGEAGADMVEFFEQYKAEEKDAKSRKDKKKAELIFALGDAEIGKLPDGRRVTYEAHDTNRFDTKGFRAADPETAAKWMKTTSSRTMYIKKGR